MAALSPDQVKLVWSDQPGARRFALFAMLNVTTGDTADLSAYYRVIKQTVWMESFGFGTGPGTFAGTTVTAPAGLANDSAYLLADGVPL